ncbi:MAG: hypothetical protein K0S28_1720 [Paucimonas sp.]|jgi:predicted aspartyl protease|nr:hypothetical protein [Paucimonas sp.]
MPVDFSGFRPIIDGSIDGHATHFLIDTGSDATVLLRSAADKFDLPVSRQRSIQSIGTNGVSDVYDIHVKEFRIGDHDADFNSLLVLWHAPRRLPFDALVGADYLLAQDLEIDPDAQYLRFHKPASAFHRFTSCADRHRAYWDEHATAVEMSTVGGDDPRPVVTVEINGREMRAMIDTGATSSMITPAAAVRAGVRRELRDSSEDGEFEAIGTERPTAWRASFDSFVLGDETVRNARLYVMEIWGPSHGVNVHAASRYSRIDMLLGTDFLKAHRVLFAVSQNRFYFSHVGGQVLGSIPQRAAPSRVATGTRNRNKGS